MGTPLSLHTTRKGKRFQFSPGHSSQGKQTGAIRCSHHLSSTATPVGQYQNTKIPKAVRYTKRIYTQLTRCHGLFGHQCFLFRTKQGLKATLKNTVALRPRKRMSAGATGRTYTIEKHTFYLRATTHLVISTEVILQRILPEYLPDLRLYR